MLSSISMEELQPQKAVYNQFKCSVVSQPSTVEHLSSNVIATFFTDQKNVCGNLTSSQKTACAFVKTLTTASRPLTLKM